MASARPSAFEVGKVFINQYYPVLRQEPESCFQFYDETSSVTRVDGDDFYTTSDIMDIKSLLMSLNVTGIEVTKLTCQDSLYGGVLLAVSGFMMSKNFSGKRNFTETFFLAPQGERGFFVLNDIFHFSDDVQVDNHAVPEIPEIDVDSEVQVPSPHIEQPVSNYELEEESREYVNSIHIEDDTPVDKYSLPDEHHEEPLPETVVMEAPVEETPAVESGANHANHVEDSTPRSINEPAGDAPKLSYASILRAKGQSSQAPVSHAPVRHNVPPPQEHQRVQPSAPQLNPSASSYVPEIGGARADEGFSQEEGELTSVYVRNLPPTVTNADLEKEFKNFGKIKPNGVFIRNKKEIGVCFAFVEYEDMSGVRNALQAATLELLGRQVYIEERRANNTGGSRGGVAPRGRGRGRGSYPIEGSRGRGGIRTSSRGSGYDGY